MQIQRHGTTRRYSDSVVHNGTLYLVEVPATTDGTIETQTASLLAGVDTLLAQAGSDKHKLLMVTVYLCRHGGLRRNECGVGCLGAGGLRANPGLRSGAFGQVGLARGDGDHRGVMSQSWLYSL